ncbi:MAG TPA: helix-turn-helix domain-containing protein [Candidatus Binataceae bacterium]|nr:helix-turn-helix domain-containing protein [Candidatus Binataceae bacterium]
MDNNVSRSDNQMKTVDEIAADLHVHRITIYRLLKAGKIPGFKVGRVWRFRANEVHAWIEKPTRRAEVDGVPNGNGR